jgi:hypothetical protein
LVFLLFLLPILLLWLGIPRLCWIRVERVDTLVSFLTLEEMVTVFFFFLQFNMMLTIDLSSIAFMWGTFLPVLISSELLSWNEIEFYQSFSAFIEMIMWFLSFLLLICCITLVVHILNHPYIPGIQPTWSWYMIFLICCWIWFANIFLRSFASKFIKEIGL